MCDTAYPGLLNYIAFSVPRFPSRSGIFSDLDQRVDGVDLPYPAGHCINAVPGMRLIREIEPLSRPYGSILFPAFPSGVGYILPIRVGPVPVVSRFSLLSVHGGTNPDRCLYPKSPGNAKISG